MLPQTAPMLVFDSEFLHTFFPFALSLSKGQASHASSNTLAPVCFDTLGTNGGL